MPNRVLLEGNQTGWHIHFIIFQVFFQTQCSMIILPKKRENILFKGTVIVHSNEKNIYIDDSRRCL